jgi:hypothetical protein
MCPRTCAADALRNLERLGVRVVARLQARVEARPGQADMPRQSAGAPGSLRRPTTRSMSSASGTLMRRNTSGRMPSFSIASACSPLQGRQQQEGQGEEQQEQWQGGVSSSSGQWPPPLLNRPACSPKQRKQGEKQQRHGSSSSRHAKGWQQLLSAASLPHHQQADAPAPSKHSAQPSAQHSTQPTTQQSTAVIPRHLRG